MQELREDAVCCRKTSACCACSKFVPGVGIWPLRTWGVLVGRCSGRGNEGEGSQVSSQPFFFFFRHVHAEDWVTGTGCSSAAIYSLPRVCGGGGRTATGGLDSEFQTHRHTHKSNVRQTYLS